MTPEDVQALAQALAPVVAEAVRTELGRIGLSPAQAGEACSLDRSSVYRLIDRGELPAASVGGRKVVLVDDLRAFLEERKNGGGRGRA